ncbi:lipopolysaccharide kinase InaA family protein [Dasania marina]|uniref:lipopolysaccharide kinase InaA family protein n=1 Tax=Dasania marina TaxID=471499 RepID=UPI0030DA41E8|tara:strand:- start:50634 stop:51458 length:825 start_codon:yes stop_codon:yes gene_type:complete
MIRWLVEIGRSTSKLEADINKLNQGELPAGWQWVNASVFAKVAFNNGDVAVFYKQFLPRNRMEQPKAWLRGSRCQRAIQQLDVLKKNNFNSPEILCWGKLARGREFMVSRAVSGVGVGSCLASYFRAVGKQPELLRAKRIIIKALGAEIGRMHKAGIVHGDLRPNNVLIELGTKAPRFHFIDNERNKVYRKIPNKLLIKNLVQIGMLASIDITKTDRVRFLDEYLNIYKEFNKALILDVSSITGHRLETAVPDRLGSPNLPRSTLEKGLVFQCD